MSRVVAIIACGITLAACSSSSSFLPSMDFMSAKPVPTSASVRFESEPPGAEVKTSTGQICITPCEMAMSTTADFSATYTLKGHEPETIPVSLDKVVGTPGPGGTPDSAKFTPNPVFAALQPTHPTKRKPAPRKPKTAAAKKPASAPAQSAPPPAASPTAPWPAPPPPAH